MASHDSTAIIEKLKSLSNLENIAGMARFGIEANNTLGVSMPVLRKMAKEIGKHHLLALELWESQIHEARILASLVDEPGLVTENQMEKWVKEFDSWDICDQCCMNLFAKTPFAYEKVKEWSTRPDVFVKRAAFALMACLAWNDKKANNAALLEFLPIIKRESNDDRNFVKKSVNWALRQVGKRNLTLNAAAIATAKEIAAMYSESPPHLSPLPRGERKTGAKSARWIASDALRELNSEAVQTRLRDKE